jgi:hypothetical protein
MSNEEANHTNEVVVEAWKKLQAAIKKAPLDDLRARLTEGEDLVFQRDQDALRGAVDAMTLHAKLGDSGAIREMVILGNQITSVLHELTSSPSLQIPSESNLQEEDQVESVCSEETGWNEELEEAIALISNLKAEEIKKSFNKVIFRLPVTEFLFSRSPEPNCEHLPDSEKNDLISELCARLTLSRLNAAIPSGVKKIAASSGMWPISVSVQEYECLQKASVHFPNFGLGEALPFRWASRKEEGPTALAFEVFVMLERERSKAFAPSHLRELRKEEESSPVGQLEQLIEAAKNAGSAGIRDIDTSAAKERTEASEDIASPSRHTSTGKFLEIPPEHRWDKFLNTTNLITLWKRKAALLPPLKKENAQDWTEAGFIFCASLCKGNFEEYTWPQSINQAVMNTGGIRSAIARILKRGFESLAKE